MANQKHEPFWDSKGYYWLKSELPAAIWRRLTGGELAMGNRRYDSYTEAIEDLLRATDADR